MPPSSPLDDPTSTNLSGFGTPTTTGEVARPHPTLFDVCHVGVVLRATLFVHAVLAVGVLFVAPTLRAWALEFALGAGIAMPAVLAWLISACALKAPLSRMSVAAQAAVSAALGAACGSAGWALAMQAGPGDFDRIGPGGPAAAGAGLALVMHQWLRMRALARTPADTTAQLAELQSRIRPHFLFNTLNSALALVRVDPQRAEHVLEDLAELFRVALTETGDSVTLDEEVELAKRYLAIEQIRFGSRLAVTWELDPDAGSARVPPLLLQPLVENAVRHGIETADDGGAIRVRTRVKGARVVISIVNSVTGTASRPGQGMALRNVKDRLRLMHDVNAQFESRRDVDAFRVQIVVPL
ncbi:MAG: histidine kinase [Burkholderiaceae bacterium]|nr:histidine kinase [Burkholderiaceae bacterium]